MTCAFGSTGKLSLHWCRGSRLSLGQGPRRAPGPGATKRARSSPPPRPNNTPAGGSPAGPDRIRLQICNHPMQARNVEPTDFANNELNPLGVDRTYNGALRMVVIESNTDLEQLDVTPSDLKAIRLRLGLDPAELAALLGMPGRRDIVENLEKARTWTMFEGHQDALMDLEEAVEEIACEILEGPRPTVLIGFPNDGVFRDLAPDIAQRLRFNSVHRMMLAKIQSSLSGAENDDQDDLIPIVEIIPSRYAEWLGSRADSPENRVEWALQHLEVYRTKPGLPIAGQRES